MAIMRALAATLCILSLPLLPHASSISPPRQPHQPIGKDTRILTFNDTGPAPQILPLLSKFEWVKGAPDGWYLERDADYNIVLGRAEKPDTVVIGQVAKLPHDIQEFWINANLTTLLIAAKATKHYRLSYSANYYLLDVRSQALTALVADQTGDVQYAEFSPDGNTVAYVRGNDVFLRDSEAEKTRRITQDGGKDMFNAVPDWVYEEEVINSRSAMWFSPDGEYLAFLSLDQTGVESYTVPTYTNGGEAPAPRYPRELDLRYPKAGTKNPTVRFKILRVETGRVENVPVDVFDEDDLIIGEVAWMTDGHDAFVYRAFNRVQDRSRHVRVSVGAKVSSETVRERDGTDGWLDHTLDMIYVGTLEGSSGETYYADRSDQDGWYHVYLFPVNGGSSIQLTKGEWEVSNILGVDREAKCVFFQAAKSHSTERHIYKVSWATKKVTPLVDDTVPAYFDASFSTRGGYYMLDYLGPDVPYQELYASSSSSSSTTTPLRVVQHNQDFYAELDQFRLPNITRFELRHPDGYTLNVMQQLPANFDPRKRYPVLFTPYGGPGSQLVDLRFQSLSWNMYVSCDPALEYAVYTVDGRGTGWRGRKYRSLVGKRLGYLEPRDQVWAARVLMKRNEWMDDEKVGMWGWSYGGYVTAKTLELDTDIFSFGMMTGPVTDWRFYDSVYTERFMKTPEENRAGYAAAAVTDVKGFERARGGFSVMHGTGDDNVHYQHTAAFVELMVREGVSPEKMKMLVFTDNNHDIEQGRADTYLYRFMTERLYDEVERREEKKGEKGKGKKGEGEVKKANGGEKDIS